MPQPTASRRDRESREAAAGAKTDAAESAAPPEVTKASVIGWLEAARQEAMDRGHTASAVTAILEMANFAGLRKDKPERRPSALPKFDGNYHEAARRIALLLRLGKEKPAKAGKAIKKGKVEAERLKQSQTSS